MNSNKLIRITTVPISLDKLLSGQLKFMNKYYEVTAISSGKQEMQEIADKEKILVFPLEMTRKITPIKDAIALHKLYRFLKKEKPFIVHTHTPKAGIVGMLAARFAGVPHRLHTVAGLPLMETSGVKRVVLDMVEKLTYYCATRVYPNSFGLKNFIISNKYCNSGKVKVLGNGSSNGIDTDHFKPALFTTDEQKALKTSLGIKDEDFVFIFVGRMVSDKGVNELISVFERIALQQKNSKLLLVGPMEPDLDPLLPSTWEQIEKNTNIIAIGFKYDVRPYFAIANVLVFPSYREGFPNVVLQAGAMGLPSIVSDINGCNEIIQNGVNGLIVPVKDTEALYESMLFMLAHRHELAVFGSNARGIILEKFQRQVIWDALLDEYKSLEHV